MQEGHAWCPRSRLLLLLLGELVSDGEGVREGGREEREVKHTKASTDPCSRTRKTCRPRSTASWPRDWGWPPSAVVCQQGTPGGQETMAVRVAASESHLRSLPLAEQWEEAGPHDLKHAFLPPSLPSCPFLPPSLPPSLTAGGAHGLGVSALRLL